MSTTTTATTTTATKGSRRFAGLRLLLAASIVALAAFAAPAAANAKVGDTKTIPSYNGTGSITYSKYWGGTAKFDNSGSTCIYVQYQYVAVLGLDSGWHRLTGDDCGGAAGSESFSKPTDSAYNGMAFKLCKNVPNGTDPCGSKVTIYN